MPGHAAGDRTSGMEGFTRMSTAWAAVVAGPGPTTLTHDGRTIDVLDLLVRGLTDGTDPDGPWYWGDIRDMEQPIVEAAEVAFSVWLARERLLPALGEARTEQVLAWLGQVHGTRVYADNWVLFPVVVACLERGLGRPIDDRLIDQGIDSMLGWDVGDGWYSDGDGHAFDRYTGWAVHWHLLHWAAIDGDRRSDVRDRVLASAATWLRDLPAWSAEDGALPLMGRSLGYKFATTALAGLAAVQGMLPIDPGMARGIMDRDIRYHLGHDAIDPATDWFRVGIWGERPGVLERYMRAGASAWAVHAFIPLGTAPPTMRSGPRPTRACRAPWAAPSILPWTSSCAGAVISSADGRSTARSGSLPRAWTTLTTSRATTTDRRTANGCTTPPSRSPTPQPTGAPHPMAPSSSRGLGAVSGIAGSWTRVTSAPTGSGHVTASWVTAAATR